MEYRGTIFSACGTCVFVNFLEEDFKNKEKFKRCLNNLMDEAFSDNFYENAPADVGSDYDNTDGGYIGVITLNEHQMRYHRSIEKNIKLLSECGFKLVRTWTNKNSGNICYMFLTQEIE